MHTNCVLPDETDKNASDVPQSICVNQSINSYDSGRLTTLIMALKEVLKPASSCFYIHVHAFEVILCTGDIAGLFVWVGRWMGSVDG